MHTVLAGQPSDLVSRRCHEAASLRTGGPDRAGDRVGHLVDGVYPYTPPPLRRAILHRCRTVSLTPARYLSGRTAPMTRTFVGTAGRDSRCAWACRNCRQVGPARRGAGPMPGARRISQTVTHPAGVAAQHRVLVPEYQQLSIHRHVLAERQDSEAEYPANQQVDDPDQHGASQPSPRQARRRWRRSPRNRVFERNRVHRYRPRQTLGRTQSHPPNRCPGSHITRMTKALLHPLRVTPGRNGRPRLRSRFVLRCQLG